jgi:hypothetical protein
MGSGAFFLAAFGIALLNWRGADLTISQHIALNMVSTVIFGVVNTLATTLIAICLLSYIARRWKFGRIFKVLSGILTGGLYLIGWFPDLFDNAASSIIHNAAALMVFVVAAVMVATLGALLWDRTNWVLKALTGAFVTAGLVGVVTASFFRGFFADNVFWIESFYLASFYGFVLCMVYCRDESKGQFLKRYLRNIEGWLERVFYKRK